VEGIPFTIGPSLVAKSILSKTPAQIGALESTSEHENRHLHMKLHLQIQIWAVPNFSVDFAGLLGYPN
jgi:hypothetical protein